MQLYTTLIIWFLYDYYCQSNIIWGDNKMKYIGIFLHYYLFLFGYIYYER